MLKAQITADDEKGNLIRLFASEERAFPNQRARYEIENSHKKTTFHIEASDATALRAVMTSITKLLMVYEKTMAVKDGQGHTIQD